jgi:hypothetical protein
MIMGLVDLIAPDDVEGTVAYVNGSSQRTACHDEDDGKRQERQYTITSLTYKLYM